eukprot:6461117-Amphidinium_carterae.1
MSLKEVGHSLQDFAVVAVAVAVAVPHTHHRYGTLEVVEGPLAPEVVEDTPPPWPMANPSQQLGTPGHFSLHLAVA